MGIYFCCLAAGVTQEHLNMPLVNALLGNREKYFYSIKDIRKNKIKEQLIIIIIVEKI